MSTASTEVEQVLQQLRLELPNKSDDEIIQVLRSYVSSDQAKDDSGMRWLSQRLSLASTQKVSVQAIQRSAGLVFYDYESGEPGTVLPGAKLEVPPALLKLVGTDFFAVVIEASLGNGGIEQVGNLTKAAPPERQSSNRRC
ncbi:MAG: hypothetical protein ACYC6N_06725 [Pirellulaceae bacterium]